MQEDGDPDALSIRSTKRARWYTCLWPSCLGHGLSCRKRRRRKFPLNLIGYDPEGKVERAASVGDLASIERLLNCRGYHVNGHDTRHRTSLHYTCAHNHPDVVALLLSKKASIDVQDDEGCTPLMKATQRDNEECVTLLLIQGANPHLRDMNGNTVLHHAVFRDNTIIARKLLDYNADMEAKTKFGLTPYKLALFEGKHQMAQFLMQYGTNAHLEAESNRLSEKPNGPTCIPEERDTSCITKKSEKQFSYSSNICTLEKMKTEINLSSLGKTSKRVLDSLELNMNMALSEDNNNEIQRLKDYDISLFRPTILSMERTSLVENNNEIQRLQDYDISLFRTTILTMELTSLVEEITDSCKNNNEIQCLQDYDFSLFSSTILTMEWISLVENNNEIQCSQDYDISLFRTAILTMAQTSLVEVERKTEDLLSILCDAHITVLHPYVCLTSTCDEDGVDPVDHKNKRAQDTLLDPTITLEDMSVLLITSVMWFLALLVSVMTRIRYLINHVFYRRNHSGDLTNQNVGQVSAEADNYSFKEEHNM